MFSFRAFSLTFTTTSREPWFAGAGKMKAGNEGVRVMVISLVSAWHKAKVSQ